eukprot:CAMPEP_0180210414 /NCGR_PEP_ID=MMETSP0987-20121128/12125_1 /TAXON_ID=697907 /ORGANISM="non described non described, Strain CCMP2293" /LENGTH=167 /DNA_ID=CAMNT_0022167355 /DNA_START=409 /DNA_END=908 /DNA_ORIENTATION=+
MAPLGMELPRTSLELLLATTPRVMNGAGAWRCAEPLCPARGGASSSGISTKGGRVTSRAGRTCPPFCCGAEGRALVPPFCGDRPLFSSDTLCESRPSPPSSESFDSFEPLGGRAEERKASTKKPATRDETTGASGWGLEGSEHTRRKDGTGARARRVFPVLPGVGWG